MIYTRHNCMPGSRVDDVEALKELRLVMSIDTDKGEVVCAHQPLRLNADGDEVETYTVRFDTIHPIRGLGRLPVLFRCCGRKH